MIKNLVILGAVHKFCVLLLALCRTEARERCRQLVLTLLVCLVVSSMLLRIKLLYKLAAPLDVEAPAACTFGQLKVRC